MKILVIGGTGFIGPPVVGELQRLGHRVAVFHRGKSTASLPPDIEHIIGDRQQIAEAQQNFEAFAPDAVVDLILSSGPQAEALMHVFHGVTRRIVAISSIDVYRACGVTHGIEPGPLRRRIIRAALPAALLMAAMVSPEIIDGCTNESHLIHSLSLPFTNASSLCPGYAR